MKSDRLLSRSSKTLSVNSSLMAMDGWKENSPAWAKETKEGRIRAERKATNPMHDQFLI